MTSIDGVSRLAELIRQRVGGQAAQRTGAQGAAGKAGKADTAAALSAEPASFSHLIQRVSTIDPTDPDKERKAFRYFLEAALLTELGMDLINDPGFYQLVDKVQAQMESHPKTQAAVRSAAVLLLRMKATPARQAP